MNVLMYPYRGMCWLGDGLFWAALITQREGDGIGLIKSQLADVSNPPETVLWKIMFLKDGKHDNKKHKITNKEVLFIT